MSEPVPVQPLVRVARWIVGQKGNAYGKPLSWAEKWDGVAGFNHQSDKAATAGYPNPLVARTVADRVETFWENLAGYKYLSDLSRSKGFKSQVAKVPTSDRLDDFVAGSGFAICLDLATSSPVFQENDLVSIDPPYQGTTGYGPELTRDRVVELALEANECGCRVLVHEAKPVITGDPWRAVELERRIGKNQRTWSRQRAEWATINFEPARTVSPEMAPVRKAGGFDGPLFDSRS